MTPTETHIRTLLATFDLQAYVSAARAHGRSGLAGTDVRRQAAALYEEIRAFRASQVATSRGLDQLLDFAQSVLFAEWHLWHNDVPRYRSYTNIDVLDWFLLNERGAACATTWNRCTLAVHVLLQDYIGFERRALCGAGPGNTASFEADRVRKRVLRLQALQGAFGPVVLTSVHARGRAVPQRWDCYLDDCAHPLALVHLTAFPQTIEHDEYAFLRTVHIAEVCFSAILASARAATQQLLVGETRQAASAVRAAVPFAGVLTPLLQTLKTTMSPEHFARFREATGDASAVQSRRYQLMQIALFGPNPNTMPVIAGVEEVRDLVRDHDPSLSCLARLAQEPMACRTPEGHELAVEMIALDKELLKWRTLHRGIGRTHLPSDKSSTGGTLGVSYLERSLGRTMKASAEPRQTAA